MATVTTVTRTSDIAGDKGTEIEAFTLRSVTFDASTDGVERVTAALRKLGITATIVRRGEAVPAGTAGNANAAREWLKANGFDVKDRGRISADLLAKVPADVLGE